MARPKKILRTESLHISLPEDLSAMVKLYLYSEVEGKIPFGRQAEFFTGLVQEFFARIGYLREEA